MIAHNKTNNLLPHMSDVSNLKFGLVLNVE